ncbi:MAG: hypothetical protein IPL51_05460 [Candidatus Competibacteraceae bacterium]|nr:hypothetical protein [Candidatus Competibacteraceae bacterium]
MQTLQHFDQHAIVQANANPTFLGCLHRRCIDSTSIVVAALGVALAQAAAGMVSTRRTLAT